ncbi:hypothetical protein XELAEV_18001994mg [Xenopus laevis]|nr:hypothetical protein XELAEV_18001994mg [Xenopus laevis]
MPCCIVKNYPHWTGRKGSEGVILHGFPNDTQKIKTWLLHIKQDFGNIDEFAQKHSLLLPIPETTIQEKACVVQMDHFYPKSFSTPLKIGQESVSDQEFQKEYSINTDDLSQNRSEPMSFSCLDSTIESTEQCKDDDFEPLTEFENTETTFEEEEEKNEKDLIKERKFLVFESCLDDLLFKVRCGFSIECTSPIEKLNKKTIGSSLSVTATCISSHEFQLGASFQKVDDMLNILGLLHISKTTYYRFQREYLFQAINRQWQLEQESLRTQLSEKALCVAGDGQYDSPGHCAKYCICLMMDMAFCKCLKKIQEDGFDVQIVATDRHSGIKKAVQDDFKTLIHQYDTWHFTKSLRKKTCDVDVLKEKWNSALNHIQGIHEWEDGLGGCAHDTLTEEEENETQWIKKSDPAYESLLTIFNDPRFDKDIEHLQCFCHTGAIEVFHSKTTSFRPKRLHFKMDAMEARTKLAALSHNRNVNRKQATIKDRRRSALDLGQKGFSYVCPKWKKT